MEVYVSIKEHSEARKNPLGGGLLLVGKEKPNKKPAKGREKI